MLQPENIGAGNEKTAKLFHQLKEVFMETIINPNQEGNTKGGSQAPEVYQLLILPSYF